MPDKKEISSIIDEGPLAGASIPLELWEQINDEESEPLEEIAGENG